MNGCGHAECERIMEEAKAQGFHGAVLPHPVVDEDAIPPRHFFLTYAYDTPDGAKFANAVLAGESPFIWFARIAMARPADWNYRLIWTHELNIKEYEMLCDLFARNTAFLNSHSEDPV
jgi:hypothetical protein